MDGASTLSADEFLRRLFDYVARNEAAHSDGSLKLSLTPSSIALLNRVHAELDAESGRGKTSWDARLQNFERLLSLLQTQAQLKVISAAVDNNQCITMNLRHLLPNLKRLELVDCKFHSVRGLSVLRPHLETLVLQNSFSELTDVFDECLADEADRAPWPMLKDVKVDFNGLYTLDSSLGNLPHMTHFSCANNNVSQLQNFQDCSSLRYVNLGSNLLRFILPDAHMTFGNITTLILRHNRLASISGVRKLFSLEVLDLSHNLLCEMAELAPLSFLPCIQNLWLNGNPVCLADNFRVKVFGIMSHRLGSGDFRLDDSFATPRESHAALDLTKTSFLEDLLVYQQRWGEQPSEDDLMSKQPRSRTGSIVSKRSYANYDGGSSFVSTMLEENSQLGPVRPKKKKKVKQRIASIEQLEASSPRNLSKGVPADDGGVYLAFLKSLYEKKGETWLSAYTEHLQKNPPLRPAKVKPSAHGSVLPTPRATAALSPLSETSKPPSAPLSSLSPSTLSASVSNLSLHSSFPLSPSLLSEEPETEDMLLESDFIAERMVPPNHLEPCILTLRPGRYFKECDLDGRPMVSESTFRLSHVNVLRNEKEITLTLFLAEGAGSMEYRLEEEYVDEIVAVLRDDFTEQHRPGWYHHPSPATCSVFVYALSTDQLEGVVREESMRQESLRREESMSLLLPPAQSMTRPIEDKSPSSSPRSLSSALQETLDEFEIPGHLDIRSTLMASSSGGSSSGYSTVNSSGASSARTSPSQSSRKLSQNDTMRKHTSDVETSMTAPPRIIQNYDLAPRGPPNTEETKGTGAANDPWRNRFVSRTATSGKIGAPPKKAAPIVRVDTVTEFYYLLLTGQPSSKQMSYFPISVKVTPPFAGIFKRAAGTELMIWLLLHPTSIYVLENIETDAQLQFREKKKDLDELQSINLATLVAPLVTLLHIPLDQLASVNLGLKLQYFSLHWQSAGPPSRLLFMSRSKDVTSKVLMALTTSYAALEKGDLKLDNEDAMLLSRIQAEVFGPTPKDLRLYAPMFFQKELKASIPVSLIQTDSTLYLTQENFDVTEAPKGGMFGARSRSRYTTVAEKPFAELSSIDLTQHATTGRMILMFGKRGLFTQHVEGYEEWLLWCRDKDTPLRLEKALQQMKAGG